MSALRERWTTFAKVYYNTFGAILSKTPLHLSNSQEFSWHTKQSSKAFGLVHSIPFCRFRISCVPCRTNVKITNSRRNRTVKVPPPLYASSEGFRFDLQPLKHSGASQEPLFLSSVASPDDYELLIKLERETTLDSRQCKGLIAALTQKVSLIQGEDLLYL